MRGSTSTVRQSKDRKRSVGIQDGLTERSEFMADETYNDASFNASSSGAAGRPTSGGGYYRGVKGKRSSESASEKGYSFEIEGCGATDDNSPIGTQSTQ